MPYKNKDDQLASQRRHYRRNREKRAEINRKRRLEIRFLIEKIKKESKCSRCPEDDWRCLDFHHIDPSLKGFSIGDAPRRGVSDEKLMDEIEKCEVLCANCHRKEHN